MENKYSKEVAKIFHLGLTKLGEEWIDYQSILGLNTTHVDELIKIIENADLESVTDQTAEGCAPMHAWRALGQLNAIKSIETLFKGLIHNNQAFTFSIELPLVIGMMDESAIVPITRYLKKDTNERFDYQVCALEGLLIMAEKNENNTQRIGKIFVETLENFFLSSHRFNGYLIKALIKLNYTSAVKIITEVHNFQQFNDEVISYDEIREFIKRK
jgi:hypothetical protein